MLRLCFTNWFRIIEKFDWYVTQGNKTCYWNNGRPINVLPECVLYFYMFLCKLHTSAMCTLRLLLMQLTASKCYWAVKRQCSVQELMNMEQKFRKQPYNLETLCHSIVIISHNSIGHFFSLVVLVTQILYGQLKIVIKQKFINSGWEAWIFNLYFFLHNIVNCYLLNDKWNQWRDECNVIITLVMTLYFCNWKTWYFSHPSLLHHYSFHYLPLLGKLNFIGHWLFKYNYNSSRNRYRNYVIIVGSASQTHV